MERYICIHGHFYQPPRENPWLEAIEMQDSARPYHDWNERITAECYAPNATSRILDGEGWIIKIVNNYSKISFNFGPTLLAWLQFGAPDVYQSILDADNESQARFSGHGSALAQAYNHVIMPLANRHDKYTQAFWGIRDFEHRFRRAPEGMWLPETAVDIETLEVLAELGIKFTILAPYQAARVRPIGGEAWRYVSGGTIDPSRAYLLNLPSGRKINLFFYDGPISRAIAFEDLLSRGENLAHRLIDAISEVREWPQLIHTATDGETYGHHKKFGDMALAYALHYIESQELARLTNYGEYLERHPPTHEVEIIENTAWSCAHGVERWRSNCGCNTGARPGWNQAWRKPLREALDWLRDVVAPQYEAKARAFLHDPWAARNDYIDVILDRSPFNIERFLFKHATHPLTADEKITVLKLLELQRHAMLMYTSCGWFFDDLSGIETVQVIQYAGRVVQLAGDLFGDSIEAGFLDRLELAKSNIREYRDGRHIYERFVRPAMVDWNKLAAHYAISSLFEDYPEQTRIYCYGVEREDYQSFEVGRSRLVIGRTRFTSEITTESALLTFGVLHIGEHHLNGGVRAFRNHEVYETTVHELSAAFNRADFTEVIRLMDRHFGQYTYSLRDLFRDEQRTVADRILESTLADIEAEYRDIYERNHPLMLFLTSLRIPLPRVLLANARFVINSDLSKAINGEAPDIDRINSLLEEAKNLGVELDTEESGFAMTRALENLMLKLVANPSDISLLRTVVAEVEMARSLPFSVNLWKVQNFYNGMLNLVKPEIEKQAERGDVSARQWVNDFAVLGRLLMVRIG